MNKLIPNGWKEYFVKDCIQWMCNGTTAQQVNYLTSFPVTRIESISEGCINPARYGYLAAPASGFELEKDDLLYSHINSIEHIGKVAIKKDKTKVFHGMNLMLLRPDTEKCGADFLYFVLSHESARRHARTEAKQAINQASLGKSDIGRYKFIAPELLSEQRKIARILSTVDALIVKSEAVAAKENLLMAGLIQSELIVRSTEWRHSPLKDVTMKISDRDHYTPEYQADGLPMISPKDFRARDEIDFSQCARVTEREFSRSRSKTDLVPGDLVFTRIGAGLGKVCLVVDSMPQFCILHSACQVRPIDSVIRGDFLKWVIRSDLFQRQIGREIQSIGVPDLGLAKIGDFLVPVPEPDEQKRIATVLGLQEAILKRTDRVLAKLHALKSGLMQDLLSGDVRVQVDAEAAA